MTISRLSAIAALLCIAFLSGCSTTVSNVGNSCAIFAQKDGLFENWRREAQKASRDYGVPVSVLMATIYVESSFDSHARPPRKKILGFIPGKRASSALGYSQALDGTWDEYRARTGQRGASRTDFGDAIYFIAWYHYQSHIRNGIALNDPYNLYLAYHSGHVGYSRGVWKSRPVAMSAAARAQKMTQIYEQQLARCP
ncbi:transglycosylase SLT domain-containing protein [Martelella endophytica]|uniref:Membrane protein n=1 Tax=Martelella endophytica TaxID=1486262 RepID=A0A0D5LQW6_MAREN|nr:transglycosylase SLT domain-containing protein [Martelella endophytica]AJY46340.1 membrane protein [Martelella endophytica]